MLKTLALLLCLASTAGAFEFRLISWSGDISDLKYLHRGTAVSVLANEYTLSPGYHADEGRPLVLFREVPADDGTMRRETVATLTPAAEATRAIILLATDPAEPRSYVAHWIDDSLEARPLQTISYRNFSSQTVAIQLGDEEPSILLPKAEHLRRSNGGGTQRLLLKAAAQTSGGWEIVASASQTFRPGRRTLVLLRDGRPGPTGITERIDFLVFHDRPAPAAP